jgi:hypothetical protein
MVSQAINDASEAEAMFLRAILDIGLKLNVDFTYEAAMLGGRVDKGGIIIDFLFTNPPTLAVNVQGIYWHYKQGSAVIRNDILDREMLAGLGLRLIWVDEDDVLDNAEFYAREALQFRDHSRLAAGG